MAAKIEVEADNTDEWKAKFEEALDSALEMVGSTVSDAAAKMCPVDTGLLRNSVTYALAGKSAAKTTYRADRGKGNKAPETGSYSGTADDAEPHQPCVYVGTNVEYAERIENGSSSQAPAGFLKPAATASKSTINQIIKRQLQG
jgi:hypothetical protein